MITTMNSYGAACEYLKKHGVIKNYCVHMDPDTGKIIKADPSMRLHKTAEQRMDDWRRKKSCADGYIWYMTGDRKEHFIKLDK